jgi:hypothetical protein
MAQTLSGCGTDVTNYRKIFCLNLESIYNLQTTEFVMTALTLRLLECDGLVRNLRNLLRAGVLIESTDIF